MEISTDKQQPKAATRATDTASQAGAETMVQSVLPTALADGELGQLQQLLFGVQLESINEQLNAIRAHSEQKISSIRNEYATELASLRAELDANQSRTSQQLQQMAAGNSDQLVKNQLENKQSQQRLESRITELDQQVSHASTDFKHQLNSAIQHLEDKKLDRAALVSLLNNLSKQISDQPVAQVNTDAKTSAVETHHDHKSR